MFLNNLPVNSILVILSEKHLTSLGDTLVCLWLTDLGSYQTIL